MGQRHVCTFRHAQRAAYRTAISAAQILTVFALWVLLILTVLWICACHYARPSKNIEAQDTKFGTNYDPEAPVQIWLWFRLQKWVALTMVYQSSGYPYFASWSSQWWEEIGMVTASNLAWFLFLLQKLTIRYLCTVGHSATWIIITGILTKLVNFCDIP